MQHAEDVYVVAEKLVASFAKACELSDYKILSTEAGATLVSRRLFCTRPLSDGLSPVLAAAFVTLDQGTGCVHIAPGHGQEDYILALENNPLLSKQEQLAIFAPVDNQGRFTDAVPEFAGQNVFKANPHIIEKLKEQGLLLGEGWTGAFLPALLAVQESGDLSGDRAVVCVDGKE